MKRFGFIIVSAIIALLFAAVTLYPHFLQRVDTTYRFKGIELMATDAEQHYGARIREIVDGHFATSNVFYHAPKDQPYLLPPIPEATVAIPAKLFGIDPVAFFVWSKAISAAALVLILVAFFAYITKRRWESLLGVTALLFAGTLLGAPWDIVAFFRGDIEYDFLRFVRPFNPLWSTPWFFAAVGFLACWIEKRATWKIILAALCTVVTLYSYFYAWSYIGAVMVLLTCWYVYKREWKRLHDLGIFLVIFLVLGIPYEWNLWQTMHHPDYPESSKRLGMALRHTPVAGIWSILFLILSFFSRRFWPRSWPLLPALAIGGLLVLNQQVITGKYLVPHHYHWYFIFPLASVSVLILILSMLDRYVRFTWMKVIGSILLLLAAIFTGFFQQQKAYDGIREEWGEMQNWKPVIDALNADAKPGDTAFVSIMRFADLITVYTPLDVYAASDANHYLVPFKRAEDVLWFRFWLEGITPVAAQKRFYSDLKLELSTRIYAIYYREAADDYLAIPDDVVAAHVASYKKYFALPLEEKLTEYPLDYIVVLPTDPKTAALTSILGRSDKIYDQDGYQIWKLR